MSMKTIIVFVFAVLFEFSSLQSNGQYSFQRGFDFFPYGINFIEAMDSGYSVACGKKESPIQLKLLFFKANSSGEVLWSKEYWNDTLLSLGASSLIGTADSGYFLTGAVYDSLHKHHQVYCLRSDKDGNVLWSRQLGEDSLEEGSTASAATADGGFIVVGQENSIWPNTHPIAFKLDSNGSLVWSAHLFSGTTGIISLLGVIVLETGEILCTGVYFDTLQYDPLPAAIVAKFSSDGDLLLCKTYAFDSGFFSFAIAPALCGSYISGTWNPEFKDSPLLMKIDDNGNFLWAKVYSSNWNSGQNYCVAETFDGGAVLMLYGQGFLGDNDNVGLIKVDSAGNFQWSHLYGHLYGLETRSTIQTRDHGFMTAGYDAIVDGSVFRLIKSDDIGQTSCNDTDVNLDTHTKICSVSNLGNKIPGISIHNLLLHVEDYNLTDSLICIDSFTSIPQTPRLCDTSTPAVQPSNKYIFITPNPCSDFFALTYQSEKEIIATITDAFGREVKRVTLSPQFQNQNISVRDLPGGVYLVVLRAGEKIETRKLVVAR